MQGRMLRHDRRECTQLRSLRVQFDLYGYAPSSALLSCGGTTVLCAINLQCGVPQFLRGDGVGWLTAEYGMLPAATSMRTPREASTMRRNGRCVEIGRVIGRSLRAVCNLSVLGERTITIDCDVLQADGGTRTACITAASIALQRAQDRWLADGTIESPIMTDEIAAVAVGLLGGRPVVDPDCMEDRQLTADFNFIMTRSGKLVEVQGGAEKEPVSWQEFEQLRTHAQQGMEKLFAFFESAYGRPSRESASREKQTE